MRGFSLALRHASSERPSSPQQGLMTTAMMGALGGRYILYFEADPHRFADSAASTGF